MKFRFFTKKIEKVVRKAENFDVFTLLWSGELRKVSGACLELYFSPVEWLKEYFDLKKNWNIRGEDHGFGHTAHREPKTHQKLKKFKIFISKVFQLD